MAFPFNNVCWIMHVQSVVRWYYNTICSIVLTKCRTNWFDIDRRARRINIRHGVYFYYRGDLELVFEVVHPFLAIKFRFSKKATKFEKKSLSYFWLERHVLCVQQRTCQKSWQWFFKKTAVELYCTNFISIRIHLYCTPNNLKTVGTPQDE